METMTRLPETSRVTVTVRVDHEDGSSMVFETMPGALDPVEFALELDMKIFESMPAYMDRVDRLMPYYSQSTVTSVDMRLTGTMSQESVARQRRNAQDNPSGELYRLTLTEAPASADHTLLPCSDPDCPLHNREATA